jgi:hypothetical protein
LLHERLAKAVAHLERLDEERSSCGNPNLGKAIQERIVWRELLDLELQDFDEQIEQLLEAVHSPVPDGGTVAHRGGEMAQPSKEDTPSRWWRLGRFFH